MDISEILTGIVVAVLIFAAGFVMGMDYAEKHK